MANGITKKDVEIAVDAIESRGERATHEAVRRELGNTGSMATVNKHVKAIRSQRENQQTNLIKLPDDLSHAITQSVSTLWEHAQQIARRDIEAIRIAALERTEVLQMEVDDICVGFDEQAEQLAQMQVELEQSSIRLRDAERALVVAETEKAELERHSTALLARLDSQAAAIEMLTSRISLNAGGENTHNNRGKGNCGSPTSK